MSPPATPLRRGYRLLRKAATKVRLQLFTLWGERRGQGFRVPKDEWEEQYQGGNWTKLDSDAERGHYEALADMYARHAPAGSALDVGCGPGVTYQHLRAKGCTDYQGIDLSETAARQAKERFPEASFSAADAETYAPGRTFDAVVFNEVVCYFPDPLVTLRRYEAALAPAGLFIVSLCDYRGNATILDKIEQTYPVLDRAECRNDQGQLWTILTLRPPARS